MSKLISCAALALAAFTVSACAGTITVDCSGGADFTDLPQAVAAAAVDDTLLVAPCIYEVESPDWPIVTGEWTPTIIGIQGPEVTVLQGDGSLSAFQMAQGVYNARTRLIGLTFRNLDSPISKPDPDSGGYLKLIGNIVEDCASGLDASGAGSSSIVTGNVIRNCGGTGLRVYHNNGLIEDNEICYCGWGIGQVCCEVPEIRHNHIHHNTSGGINTSFSCNIHHNVIEHNGGPGIDCYMSGIVEHNTIRFNDVGLYQHTHPLVGLHYNDICENIIYNYEASQFTARAYDFDATMNWWGTTDPLQISVGIHDCHDDPGINCCVVFDPWCTSPGCESTPAEFSTWGRIKAIYRGGRD